MKNLHSLLLHLAVPLLAVVGTSPARAQVKPNQPVVAVFDVEQPSPILAKNEAQTLTNYLSTKLGESGRLLIIPSKDIRRLLTEQKSESYKACYDEACQIEIGRELAAQYTVSSSLGKLGESCILTAALFDLAKAAAVKTASGKGKCKPDELISAVESIAQALEEAVAPGAPPAPQKIASAPLPVKTEQVIYQAPPFRPDPSSISWARTAGWLGIVAGVAAAGLAVGAEFTKEDENDIPSNLMGAAATTLVGAMGPIMNSAAGSARSGTSALGSPAMRLTAWISYGTCLTGATILLVNGFSSDSAPPPGVISAVGGVGLLTMIFFAIDDFKSAGEVESLYPEKDPEPAKVSLSPLFAPVRLPDGSSAALLGIMGRF